MSLPQTPLPMLPLQKSYQSGWDIFFLQLDYIPCYGQQHPVPTVNSIVSDDLPEPHQTSPPTHKFLPWKLHDPHFACSCLSVASGVTQANQALKGFSTMTSTKHLMAGGWRPGTQPVRTKCPLPPLECERSSLLEMGAEFLMDWGLCQMPETQRTSLWHLFEWNLIWEREGSQGEVTVVQMFHMDSYRDSHNMKGEP